MVCAEKDEIQDRPVGIHCSDKVRTGRVNSTEMTMMEKAN
jgi:hypothetical protein